MSIIERIEKTRAEMVDLGMRKGLQGPQVIVKSQVLDELINQYYRAKEKPRWQAKCYVY